MEVAADRSGPVRAANLSMFLYHERTPQRAWIGRNSIPVSGTNRESDYGLVIRS
jgi:hypothetical protein